MLCKIVLCQNRLAGTVFTSDDKAIPYAVVSTLMGNSCMCDASGNYHLEITTDDNCILASAYGYKTDTLLLTDVSNSVDFKLELMRFDINEVRVVTRQNVEQKSMVSAVSIGKTEMEPLNPQNVSQILQNTPGFTNRTGYQSPLTLRGFSGKRILVLRNGNRRFSSYPAGVMSHTINVYDLERIEVEKGAASVVYGAGAMAGIINLVDKSPFKQKGFNGRFITGYGSVNNEQNYLACGGWSDGKFAVKGAVRYRKADDFRFADGSIAENSFYQDNDVFITSGYRFSDDHSIVVSFDMHNGGPWGKPVGFNGSDYMRVRTEKEYTNNYSLKYEGRDLGLFSHLEWNLFYSDESRELVKDFYTAAGYQLSYTEITNFSDYNYGSHLKTDIDINEKFKITAGAEGYSFHISTPVDAVDYIEEIAFENRVCKDARSYNSGIYVENKYDLTKNSKLVGGIRYNYSAVYEGELHHPEEDERQDEKSAVTGNLSASVTTGKRTKLKMNIARSFRFPEVSELYADSYTSNGVVYGNPDLTAEYCYSLDLAFNYKKEWFGFELSPFIWFMDDMIARTELKGMVGTNFTYTNIGQTRIFGGEAQCNFHFKELLKTSDKLSLWLGFAYLNGTDITESASFKEGEPLDFVPPFNFKANLNYQVSFNDKLKLEAGFRSIYYTEQKQLGEFSYATPSYWIMQGNLGATYLKSTIRPKLNLSVNNLFNKEYYSYQAYLPSEGRDIRFFLTLNF
nr:TonB-dependent receptor [uncultured Carboxylicivirga sp.]